MVQSIWRGHHCPFPGRNQIKTMPTGLIDSFSASISRAFFVNHFLLFVDIVH